MDLNNVMIGVNQMLRLFLLFIPPCAGFQLVQWFA